MLFVVLTAAFCAAAEDRVSLRDEVFVKGPKVVLGDIADVRGDNAAYLSSFELGQAASPGNSTVVNVALVKSKLNAAGIIDVTVDGSPRVTARTMYLDITKGMISDALREFIEIEMPWQLDATTIEIAPPAQGFVVPDGNVEFRFRRNPQYAFIGAGLFRATCSWTAKSRNRSTRARPSRATATLSPPPPTSNAAEAFLRPICGSKNARCPDWIAARSSTSPT